MSIRRSPGLSEADADALLSGRFLPGHDDLGEIVGLLRTVATVAAPSPTDALAAVLSAGFAPLPVASAPGRARWSRWSVRTAAAAGAVMSMTLGAATANALPAPLQTAVADLVGAVTPLELPRPAAGSGIDDDGTPIEQPPTPGQESSEEEPLAELSVPTGAPVAAPPEPNPSAVAPPRLVAPADDEGDEVEPDADEPDAEQSDAEHSGADESDIDEPDTDEPDTEQSDVEQSNTEQSDVDEPDVDEPEVDEPDVDQTGAEQSDADEPDIDESDAAQTDVEPYTGDGLDQGDPDLLG